jgi:uncharacterized protein
MIIIQLDPEVGQLDLSYEFEVPVDPDVAFRALSSPAVMARCLPDAQLTPRQDDCSSDSLTLRLAAIDAALDGEFRIRSVDGAARQAHLVAVGSSRRGWGATGTVATVNVDEVDGLSVVSIAVALGTGRADATANVVWDLAESLLSQFGRNLEAVLLGDGALAAQPPPALPPASASPETAGDEDGHPTPLDAFGVGTRPGDRLQGPTAELVNSWSTGMRRIAVAGLISLCVAVVIRWRLARSLQRRLVDERT